MRWFCLLGVVAVGSVGLAAQRIEVLNGTHGAEVCWYGGAPLPATAVTCQPAARPLALPDGVATLFARQAPDLVSMPVIIADGQLPRSLDLLPAATVTSPEGAADLFAYIAGAGAVLPAPTVPADTSVVPLRIRNRAIVDIAAPVRLAPGAKASVLGRPDNRWYLVATIQRPIAAATARDPIEIYLQTAKRRLLPLVEVPRTAACLAIFTDSQRGDGRVTATGRGWKTIERDIPVMETGNITVLPEPLVAVRVTKLVVRWWTARPLDHLVQGAEPECRSATRNTWNLTRDPKSPFAMSLLQCPTIPNRNEACVPFLTQGLDAGAMKGEVTFEEVPPGEYQLRVTYPFLPTLSRLTRVEDSPQTDEEFELRYFTFFGRVTQSGQPIRARLFATVSDDDGMYRAVLPDQLGRTSEFVSPCDGSPTYRMLFDDPPRDNARFDIEIPDATIHTLVFDEQTRAPLRDALVRYSQRHREKDSGFSDNVGKTDKAGLVDISHVDKGPEIVVCAAHQDYERRCSESFVMEGTDKTVELPLVKSLALSGRVITARALQRATLMWVAPDGTLSESVNVKTDGTFTFGKHHQAGEILTLVSSSHPLFVTRQLMPTSDKQLFEINVPPGPERTLTVARGAQDSGPTKYLSLVIGGVPIPLTALDVYLSRRLGTQAFIDSGSTIEIPSILVTGPIELILLSGSIPVDRDPVVAPGNATISRIPLGDATRLDVSNR